ncbi:sterol desaturase family protein [Sphingomonas glaciei]|uniref:Sterol desaturase family protein n=1 Tax=Sphingomonas glaciei TaxID=2938948 RepID=A0ABY5MVE3_9SPHN|nr:sterol desaturase family protein [Sphingomonas glaciei]UUR08213.1 sterol desaturase family protein [Sphingomonas glaciei]
MTFPWQLEPWIRLGAFAGVLALLALGELLAPRRRQEVGRATRWPANLGLVALDTLLVRLLFPVAAVGAAIFAEERAWGLFNLLALPAWFEIALAVIILDLLIYGQHVLFHAVPPLWRVHRVHHADLEFDATTGLRFHPIEILLSMAIKIAAVVLLGAAALAVLIFEVLLNATAMWSHSNLRLPTRVDRVLRHLFVTPDMHRVHHSIVPRETHSNFGFNLALWDKLFGTYRHQPEAGHEGMTIGIPQFRDRGELKLGRLLLQPFRTEGR